MAQKDVSKANLDGYSLHTLQNSLYNYVHADPQGGLARGCLPAGWQLRKVCVFAPTAHTGTYMLCHLLPDRAEYRQQSLRAATYLLRTEYIRSTQTKLHYAQSRHPAVAGSIWAMWGRLRLSTWSSILRPPICVSVYQVPKSSYLPTYLCTPCSRLKYRVDVTDDQLRDVVPQLTSSQDATSA